MVLVTFDIRTPKHPVAHIPSPSVGALDLGHVLILKLDFNGKNLDQHYGSFMFYW